jgi:hypothetical protein
MTQAAGVNHAGATSCPTVTMYSQLELSPGISGGQAPPGAEPHEAMIGPLRGRRLVVAKTHLMGRPGYITWRGTTLWSD